MKGWGQREQCLLQCPIAKTILFLSSILLLLPSFSTPLFLPSLLSSPLFKNSKPLFFHLVKFILLLRCLLLFRILESGILLFCYIITFFLNKSPNSRLQFSPFITEWRYRYKLPFKIHVKHFLNKSTKYLISLSNCPGFRMEVGNGKALSAHLVPSSPTAACAHISLKT